MPKIAIYHLSIMSNHLGGGISFKNERLMWWSVKIERYTVAPEACSSFVRHHSRSGRLPSPPQSCVQQEECARAGAVKWSC
jgi:hypothetical protein